MPQLLKGGSGPLLIFSLKPGYLEFRDVLASITSGLFWPGLLIPFEGWVSTQRLWPQNKIELELFDLTHGLLVWIEISPQAVNDLFQRFVFCAVSGVYTGCLGTEPTA